jgi:hypothetical protein
MRIYKFIEGSDKEDFETETDEVINAKAAIAGQDVLIKRKKKV